MKDLYFLSDWKAFFSAMDTSREELAEVRNALEEEDIEKAIDSYANVFRTKPLESILFADYGARDPNYGTSVADRHVAGRLWSEGYPPDQTVEVDPESLDWQRCPYTLITRFPYFEAVTKAYWHTQDPRYARFIVAYCLSYIRSWPMELFEGHEDFEGIHQPLGPFDFNKWYPIFLKKKLPIQPWHWNMISQRLQFWADAVKTIRSCPEVSSEELLLILRRLHEEASFAQLRDGRAGTIPWKYTYCNGGLDMLRGVLVASRLLEDFRSSLEWMRESAEGFVDYFTVSFYPDGFCKELAVGYSASCTLRVLEIAYELKNEPAVAASKKKLMAVATALPALRKPNGRTPGFGDSSIGQVALNYTPPCIAEWLGLQWINSLREGKSKPEPPFLSYPLLGMEFYNGYYVMRSGWDCDACCLMMDAGPLGQWHQHGDRLSFDLTAYGADFIIDPGGRGDLQAGFLHSTVTVDGEDEMCFVRLADPVTGGIFARGDTGAAKDTHNNWPLVVRSPLSENIWETTERHDLLDAVYTFRPKRDVQWRRRMLFVRPGYWVMQDVLTAEDGSEEAENRMVEVEQNFQFDRGIRVELTSEGAVATATNGAKLFVKRLDSKRPDNLLEARITEGEENPHDTNFANQAVKPLGKPYPHGRGWVCYDYEAPRRSAPALTFCGKVTLPCMLTIALIPLPSGAPDASLPEITCRRKGEEMVWRLPQEVGDLVWRTSITKSLIE